MKFTYARTRKDLEEIADMMGKIFRRKNWFEFYKQRMDYQTKSPYFKPEHSRIAREKGKIMGHTSIIEKYIRVGGAEVKIAGIGDVYTHPDARGKHVATHLMNDALAYMKQNHYPLSMLYGIPNFYHKFGYIEAMGDFKVFVPLKNVAHVRSETSLRPCRESDIPAINRLYNQATRERTGAVIRAPESWFNIANPKELYVTVDSRDKATGYVIYKKVWGGGGYIAEVIAPTEKIRRVILAFYVDKARQGSHAELEFRLSPRDPFACFLKDFGSRQVIQYFAEREGNAMLRLIDLPLFLKKIRRVLESRLNLSPFVKGKKGINIVTDDAGKASLIFERRNLKIQKRPVKNLPILELPQNLLTRSVIGYWNVDRLISRVQAAGYKVPRETRPLLEVLFPEQTPFTSEPDYF